MSSVCDFMFAHNLFLMSLKKIDKNSLPASVFPCEYNCGIFKRKINRYLRTMGFLLFSIIQVEVAYRLRPIILSH